MKIRCNDVVKSALWMQQRRNLRVEGKFTGTGSANRGSYNMGEMRHILKTKRRRAIFPTCDWSLSNLLPQRSHKPDWWTQQGLQLRDWRGDKCKVQSSVLWWYLCGWWRRGFPERTWKLCLIKCPENLFYHLLHDLFTFSFHRLTAFKCHWRYFLIWIQPQPAEWNMSLIVCIFYNAVGTHDVLFVYLLQRAVNSGSYSRHVPFCVPK